MIGGVTLRLQVAGLPGEPGRAGLVLTETVLVLTGCDARMPL
jgi:hypothetical protein